MLSVIRTGWNGNVSVHTYWTELGYMPGVLMLETQRFVASVKLMNSTSCDLILVIGTLDLP